MRLDKLVVICTSRDPDRVATGTLHDRCQPLAEHRRAGGFDTVVAESRAVWQRLWEDCDARSWATPGTPAPLRFCIYHLLIAANPDDPTVNIGANALAGSATGVTCSGTPRSSCSRSSSSPSRTPPMRYCATATTLDGAGRTPAGTALGRAMPGSPPTPVGRNALYTADGANRFWTREEELHVSADVAYGIFRVEATGDTAFLRDVGAEILFETSRFWVDRVEPAAGGEGYELRQVMGPDEFHSHIDNNAFTNRLAQWHLTQAVNLFDELRDQHPEAFAALGSKIGLEPKERDRWQEVADGLVGARHREGVIEQFTGYFERDDVPITEWDENNMPRYPKATTTSTARPPAAQAARRRHADVPASRRVRRRDQTGELRLLRGLDAAQVVVEPLDPRDHGYRGRRHYSGGPVLRALGLCGPQRQPGQHRRGHAHRLRAGPGRSSSTGSVGCASSAAGWPSIRGCPTTGKASASAFRWRGRPIHVTVDHEHVTLRLGGPDGGTEEVIVSGKPVQLTAGMPAQVALEATMRTPLRPPSPGRECPEGR